MNKLKPILSARKDCTISYTIVILAFILIQTMIATGNITSSLKGQLVPICAYIVMAISLNLTVGILGELSLGHAGFMSVGAFTGIVVSTSLAAAIPNGPSAPCHFHDRRRPFLPELQDSSSASPYFV